MNAFTVRTHDVPRADGSVLVVEQKYDDAKMQAHIDRTLRAYKAPKGDQGPRYEAITGAAYSFACLLIDLCPPSAELTLALRHIEDARMRANQSIAVNE